MNHLWHMRVDGWYAYSVYCEEQQLDSMRNAFIMACHPLNEPVLSEITFERVDPDEYELQEEDIQ